MADEFCGGSCSLLEALPSGASVRCLLFADHTQRQLEKFAKTSSTLSEFINKSETVLSCTEMIFLDDAVVEFLEEQDPAAAKQVKVIANQLNWTVCDTIKEKQRQNTTMQLLNGIWC